MTFVNSTTAVILLGLFLGLNSTAQTTHLIRGVDFAYLPDTAYLTAGDSIHFDPTGGLHNMTETDLPAWLINQAITNGGFDTVIGADTTFAIDTAGTYYFVCLPHGYVGMKGVLIVSPLSTGLETPTHSSIGIGPNPTNGPIRVDTNYDVLEVFDLMGRLQGKFSGNRIDLSALKSGVYVLVIRKDDKTYVERILRI